MKIKSKYFVITTCRNSADNIEKAILSLMTQTLKPEYVIIIDDGSTDKTPFILKELTKKFDNIYIITNPDLGYDIKRVVNNWNKAIKLTIEEKLKETDYHLIDTDDTIYEKDYAEKIISFMDQNPTYAAVSGVFDDNKYVTPHGAGRFVRNSFFNTVHKLYPEQMGYETYVLIMARKSNFDYTVLHEARYEHTRQLGRNHCFYEFGASMRTLGYHPIFALGRFLSCFITNKPVNRIGSLYMLYHYLFYQPKKEGYDSMYPEDTRQFLRKMQYNRIKSVFKLQTKILLFL